MKDIIPIIIIEFNTFERTIKYIKDFIDKVICSEKFSFIIVDNAISIENYTKLKEGLKIQFYTNFTEKTICYLNENRVTQSFFIDVCYSKRNFDIMLLKANENYGFAIGNNIGANAAKQLYTVKHIIFSNSDIQFKYKGFNLSEMLKIIKSNEKIALIGPRIVGLDNKPQTPCSQKSLWERWNKQSIIFPINKFFNSKWLSDSDDTMSLKKDSFVYRIIGAFMVFDFNKFEDIGMFDENTFLFAEELIIAEKLQKKGYKTHYCNTEELIHEQGGTTKKVFDFYNKIKIRFRSEIYYYQNYMNVKRKSIYLSIILFYVFMIKLKFYYFLKKLIKY